MKEKRARNYSKIFFFEKVGKSFFCLEVMPRSGDPAHFYLAPTPPPKKKFSCACLRPCPRFNVLNNGEKRREPTITNTLLRKKEELKSRWSRNDPCNSNLINFA